MSKISKIGKKPIEIPESITVQVKDGKVEVSGPKDSLSQDIPLEIKVELKENQIRVSPRVATEKAKAISGTIRQLIFNMIKGVKDGWSKTLEISGTGFKAVLAGEKLSLSLGFSHQIEVVPPGGITFSVSERKIIVAGADKAVVGRVAARIKSIIILKISV